MGNKGEKKHEENLALSDHAGLHRLTTVWLQRGFGAGKRANHVDNWDRIQKRGFVTVGLDDTSCPWASGKRVASWLVMMLT